MMNRYRDTFDFMDDTRRQRERFGENESNAPKTESDSDSTIELSLMLQQDRPLALMVTDSKRPGMRWVSLPKELIEYEIKSPGIVVVKLSERLAVEKGLV